MKLQTLKRKVMLERSELQRFCVCFFKKVYSGGFIIISDIHYMAYTNPDFRTRIFTRHGFVTNANYGTVLASIIK